MLQQVLSRIHFRLPSFLTSGHRPRLDTVPTDTGLLGSDNVDTCAIDLPQMVQQCVTEELVRAGLKHHQFGVKLSDISRRGIEMSYVAFIKVDRYVPDLLDRSQVIEAQVRDRLQRVYQIELRQMFWRWGEAAVTPYEVELRQLRQKH